MNAKHIEDKFAMLGARFKLNAAPAGRASEDYAVDIQTDGRGQFFELRTPEMLRHSLDVNVLQTDKRDRHLLLFVRPAEGKAARFLCGHDEREWFVAAVPGGASSVAQAKEALKPREVRWLQSRMGVPARQWNLRRNAAFRRQGEWFFIPAPGWRWGQDRINDKAVLRNEPLRRGEGKPHVVEQLFRVAGQVAYVCPRHPNGVTEAHYRSLLQNNPDAARWSWQVLRSNPRVYAKGRIRHPDHATITLPIWHRVMMNTETETDSMRNVAFID